MSEKRATDPDEKNFEDDVCMLNYAFATSSTPREVYLTEGPAAHFSDAPIDSCFRYCHRCLDHDPPAELRERKDPEPETSSVALESENRQDGELGYCGFRTTQMLLYYLLSIARGRALHLPISPNIQLVEGAANALAPGTKRQISEVPEMDELQNLLGEAWAAGVGTRTKPVEHPGDEKPKIGTGELLTPLTYPHVPHKHNTISSSEGDDASASEKGPHPSRLESTNNALADGESAGLSSSSAKVTRAQRVLSFAVDYFTKGPGDRSSWPTLCNPNCAPLVEIRVTTNKVYAMQKSPLYLEHDRHSVIVVSVEKQGLTDAEYYYVPAVSHHVPTEEKAEPRTTLREKCVRWFKKKVQREKPKEEKQETAEKETASVNRVWNLVVFDPSTRVPPSLLSDELDQWKNDGEGTLAWHRLSCSRDTDIEDKMRSRCRLSMSDKEHFEIITLELPGLANGKKDHEV